MRSWTLILMAAVLAISYSTTLATDYYVDKDNGSDTNSGLSLSEAFATIQKAISTFSGGDTIYIAGEAVYLGRVVKLCPKVLCKQWSACSQEFKSAT